MGIKRLLQYLDPVAAPPSTVEQELVTRARYKARLSLRPSDAMSRELPRVFRLIRDLDNIETVILRDNLSLQNEESIEALKEYIQANDGLITLRLPRCLLGSWLTCGLIQTVSRHSSLKFLDLGSNRLDNRDLCGPVFRELLRRNDTLEGLFLGYSKFRDCTRQLAKGLRRNSTLLTLKLYACELDDDSFACIVDAHVHHQASVGSRRSMFDVTVFLERHLMVY